MANPVGAIWSHFGSPVVSWSVHNRISPSRTAASAESVIVGLPRVCVHGISGSRPTSAKSLSTLHVFRDFGFKRDRCHLTLRSLHFQFFLRRGYSVAQAGVQWRYRVAVSTQFDSCNMHIRTEYIAVSLTQRRHFRENFGISSKSRQAH